VSVRRDYKPDPGGQNRHRLRLHALLVLTLVMIGLFGSLLAYLHSQPPTSMAQLPPIVAGKGKEATPVKSAATTPPPTPPAFKPKYEFYKVLPERKLLIGNEDTGQTPAKQSQPALPALELIGRSTKPGTSPPSATAGQTGGTDKQTARYILHAGSFRNYAEADQRKASLLALGVPARVETVTGTDGNKVYRVRVGPLPDTEMKALRQRIRENHINVSVKIVD
jgi:cell division protein FtsN